MKYLNSLIEEMVVYKLTWPLQMASFEPTCRMHNARQRTQDNANRHKLVQAPLLHNALMHITWKSPTAASLGLHRLTLLGQLLDPLAPHTQQLLAKHASVHHHMHIQRINCIKWAMAQQRPVTHQGGQEGGILT